MIKIQESEMSFGEFQEENLFHYERNSIKICAGGKKC